MYQRSTGIILKKIDFKEDDEIITIYSGDFGKIDVLSRGAKKMVAKLTPSLQLFNWIDFEFVNGKSLKTITSATVLNNFRKTQEDIFRIKVLMKTVKIIDKLVTEPEKDSQLWEFILNFYVVLPNIKLENDEETQTLIDFFETKVLKILGDL